MCGINIIKSCDRVHCQLISNPEEEEEEDVVEVMLEEEVEEEENEVEDEADMGVVAVILAGVAILDAAAVVAATLVGVAILDAVDTVTITGTMMNGEDETILLVIMTATTTATTGSTMIEQGTLIAGEALAMRVVGEGATMGETMVVGIMVIGKDTKTATLTGEILVNANVAIHLIAVRVWMNSGACERLQRKQTILIINSEGKVAVRASLQVTESVTTVRGARVGASAETAVDLAASARLLIDGVMIAAGVIVGAAVVTEVGAASTTTKAAIRRNKDITRIEIGVPSIANEGTIARRKKEVVAATDTAVANEGTTAMKKKAVLLLVAVAAIIILVEASADMTVTNKAMTTIAVAVENIRNTTSDTSIGNVVAVIADSLQLSCNTEIAPDWD